MANARKPLSLYAEHARISKEAARKQLQRVGIDYMQEFDFAEADRRREAARHADRVPFSKPIYGNSEDDNQLDSSPNSANPNDLKVQSFSEAQTRERHFKAKLAELEFLERVGKLVSKEAVEVEAFRTARLVRDSILNIPDRLAGQLAAESDHRKIYDLLSKELRQALENLAAEVIGKKMDEKALPDGT